MIGRVLSKKEVEFIEMTDESFSSSDFEHAIFDGVRTTLRLPIKKKFIFEKINSFFSWVESLQQYDDVYIIANSENHCLQNINFKKTDLIVVFNKFSHDFIYHLDCDVVIVNRQMGKHKYLFHVSESAPTEKKNIKYIAMSDYFEYINIDDVDFLLKYDYITCADFIPYSFDKRVIPSTGYTLLYIINYYFKGHEFIKKVHPIGFQFTGLPCHDWEYERILKERLSFEWL
jgi:hypothetical protein